MAPWSRYTNGGEERSFAELGLRTPTLSRDRHSDSVAMPTIAQTAQGARGDSADILLLAEATRTIYEFYFIARAIEGGEGVAERRLKNALGNALSEPMDIRDEGDGNSRPRNTQFELFLEAWFTSGGATPSTGGAGSPASNRSRVARSCGEARKKPREDSTTST